MDERGADSVQSADAATLHPQVAIDRIHSLATKIRDSVQFDVAEGSRSSRNRLAIKILQDLDDATESLFASAGIRESVVACTETLNEIESDASVLLLSKTGGGMLDLDDTSYSLNPEVGIFTRRMNKLLAAVRSIERTWDFQYELWSQKRTVANDLGCDVRQLT
jgi:hypothetical protein